MNSQLDLFLVEEIWMKILCNLVKTKSLEASCSSFENSRSFQSVKRFWSWNNILFLLAEPSLIIAWVGSRGMWLVTNTWLPGAVQLQGLRNQDCTLWLCQPETYVATSTTKNPTETGKGLPSWSFFHTRRTSGKPHGVSLCPGVPYALTVSNIKVRGGILGVTFWSLRRMLWMSISYIYIHINMHIFTPICKTWTTLPKIFADGWFNYQENLCEFLKLTLTFQKGWGITIDLHASWLASRTQSQYFAISFAGAKNISQNSVEMFRTHLILWCKDADASFLIIFLCLSLREKNIFFFQKVDFII